MTAVEVARTAKLAAGEVVGQASGLPPGASSTKTADLNQFLNSEITFAGRMPAAAGWKPASLLIAGHASLCVEIVGQQSAVTSAFACSPLKLLIPRARGESAWAYLSSLGGGLLAGDQNRLDLKLGP